MVSVVVPAYNAGEFLEECLESLRRQTLNDFEVIVVDDGSTDNTSDITKRFAKRDRRFRLLITTNGGVSRARNLGIDESRGDLITFVDADDALHPEALERMSEAIKQGDVCITDFNDHPAGPLTSTDPETYNYEEGVGRILYRERMHNSPWAVMMRRRLLGDSQRFREGIRYEDLDAFYRFYEGARIVHLRQPLYFYRKNPRSFINNWSESRLDVLDVTDRLVDYMKERHPALTAAAEDRRFSAHFNMLLLMTRLGVKNDEARARCRAVIKAGRLRALKDPNVRLKNKIGALASYLGTPGLWLLSRFY